MCALYTKMFEKCRNLVVVVMETSIFASCGYECEHSEKVYESLPSVCVSESVDIDVSLLPYERPWTGYNIPNRYQVVCNAEGEGPFELFVSKWYGAGEYDLMFGTSGAPARSVASDILASEDLEGVVSLKCSVSIPEEWECKLVEVCEPTICYGEFVCSLVHGKEHVGVATASLVSSEGCFDWYYEDPYIVRE